MLKGQEALLTNITRMVSPTSALITGPKQIVERARQLRSKFLGDQASQGSQAEGSRRRVDASTTSVPPKVIQP